MTYRRNTGSIFNEDTLHTFSRHIGDRVVEDDCDLWTFVSGYPRAHADCGHQCANNKCQAQQPD